MRNPEKKQIMKEYLNAMKEADQVYDDLIGYRAAHGELLDLMDTDPDSEIVTKYMELRSISIQKEIAALRAHRKINNLIKSITNDNTINDREALVLSLRYIHGLKINQIADNMCCTKESIYRMINRALELIEV